MLMLLHQIKTISGTIQEKKFKKEKNKERKKRKRKGNKLEKHSLVFKSLMLLLDSQEMKEKNVGRFLSIICHFQLLQMVGTNGESNDKQLSEGMIMTFRVIFSRFGKWIQIYHFQNIVQTLIKQTNNKLRLIKVFPRPVFPHSCLSYTLVSKLEFYFLYARYPADFEENKAPQCKIQEFLMDSRYIFIYLK